MTTAAPGAATGVAVTDSTPPTRSTRRAKATPGRLRCAMPKKAARVANPALSSRSRNGGGSDGGEKQTSPGPAHRRGRTVRAFQDPCDVSDEGRPQALAPLVHCGQALADGGAPPGLPGLPYPASHRQTTPQGGPSQKFSSRDRQRGGGHNSTVRAVKGPRPMRGDVLRTP
jgi:hypothetical protein